MDESAFAARLAESQAGIERELQNLLEPEPKPGEPARPKRLIEAMRYATLGGGKRLRPVLTVETARALAAAERRIAHRLDEALGPRRLAGFRLEAKQSFELALDSNLGFGEPRRKGAIVHWRGLNPYAP